MCIPCHGSQTVSTPTKSPSTLRNIFLGQILLIYVTFYTVINWIDYSFNIIQHLHIRMSKFFNFFNIIIQIKNFSFAFETNKKLNKFDFFCLVCSIDRPMSSHRLSHSTGDEKFELRHDSEILCSGWKTSYLLHGWRGNRTQSSVNLTHVQIYCKKVVVFLFRLRIL